MNGIDPTDLGNIKRLRARYPQMSEPIDGAQFDGRRARIVLCSEQIAQGDIRPEGGKEGAE